MPRARQLLEQARELVAPGDNADPDAGGREEVARKHYLADLPERAVRSYVERNFGVCCAMESNWPRAEDHWRKAVDLLPTNASAHYLEGCYYQVTGSCGLGILSIQKAIALDPDFRIAYIGLSNCYLLKGEYELAISACNGCLRRFPDALQAQFNIGQAQYQLVRAAVNGQSMSKEEVARRSEVALKAYEAVKKKSPENWSKDDARVLQWLKPPGTLPESTHRSMKLEAVHIWKVYGWRP
eukprot:gnl/TRDRNA2_/TRDRNA2_82799_c1_seq1.p1 gnl/TRDRNA2_/TRDRNA2_82799_c1~~gnl/TRDRNA2_/TRDRNA2_82799_c1_seq1.p1  ORF type:complete len:257 (-),score=40.63 gnl/TRDRNA2_/TRDRNA2_82799_c1_seq1:51-770(-)